ncbi:putative cleavage and polyadenylylation specificity factor [Penicillium brasilianum]|uniref:Cleavage and polyadenylation specificity factor subunit 2 n=1 Tax=Penicillium brasilianum TaxID=104259 RepID=A0A1S9RNC7_PENBI|nr:putative cleavage and polyadenylylation specificity factor [Penicillium brasilianum]
MFTFTPLLGAQSSSSRASQSILELDGGIKILVDVGWDETFDTRDLAELEKHIPTLSLILLTHATPAHIGAFVHCCRTFPLFTQIPIYATSPVIAFGRTCLQDLYVSSPLASTFLPKASISEPGASAAFAVGSAGDGEDSTGTAGSSGRILLQAPTTEEIARYFSLITPLKYSQPHQPLPSPFSPPLDGLTLTAYNAGHTVGGTIWHIQHGMESIVYAMDWNQARESVVAGAAWFGGSGASGTEVIEQLRKPTALICSSQGGDKFAVSGGRKKRDDLLLDMIRSSLAKGGTVLIPTDTSSRVLELAYALEHAWREASTGEKGDVLQGAGLYLAGRKVNTTMRLARSMLEWMDENIVREFEAAEGADGQKTGGQGQDKGSGKGVGPFAFKHLKTVERKKRLEKLLADQGPKVILASDTSLAWGFSKDSLRQVAEGPNNLLLLTESFRKTKSDSMDELSSTASLGSMIWQWYEERRDGVALEKGPDGELLEQVHSGGRELTWTDVQRAPLDARDQLLYQQYLATKRQLQDTSQARGQEDLETAADALDDRSSSTSSEDSDGEQQGRVLNFSTTLAHSNRNKLALTDEDLGINVLLRRKNVYDYDVRGKKGRERMFPYVAPRKRGDEYGEFIRPEEYLRAEEREEIDMQQRRSDAQTKLGQKRRWDEAAGTGGRRLSDGAGGRKRQHLSTNGQKVDSGIADDLSLPSEGDGADAAASSEDEADTQSFEGPAKAVYNKETITINARIAFVDFMGLHDKRSLEMLIPLIQPQKLILVGGMKDQTSALADECKKLLTVKVGGDVSTTSADAAAIIFTPANGEVIDASVDTNAWTVKLSNSLVKRLNWQHVRSLGVVALTAQLRAPELPIEEEDADADVAGKKMKLAKDDAASSAVAPTFNGASKTAEKHEAFPLLDTLPASMAAVTRSMTRPLHVGDLRLADLRKLMQAAGHTAEFRGEGTLLIDKSVAVRKSATGRIEIEAAAQASANQAALGRNASSFLAVKRKIYEGLAVVAGN